MIIALCISSLFLIFLAFEIGRATGAAAAAERVRQLECGNDALRRAVNFTEAENECLQKKLAARTAQIVDFSTRARKDLEEIDAAPDDGALRDINNFTDAARLKLDEEFGGY